MHAQAGDELIVKGPRAGDAGRRGVIIEVRSAKGGPPCLVRWSDGHETSYFPSSGAMVHHVRQPVREQARES